MSSFSVEGFIGNGCLKSLVPKLIEDGWDDVPTLKLMNSDDMNALNMSQDHKEALEIRTYLHDRGLMHYADKLEGTKKSLAHLLNMSIADISRTFGMKRGHVARFMDKTRTSKTESLLNAYSFQSRRQQKDATSRNSSFYSREFPSGYYKSMPSRTISVGRSSNYSSFSDVSIDKSLSELKIKDGHVFKGIVASMPAETRACGCIQPSPITDDVAPLSSIEKITVQKLTPPYNIGKQPLIRTKTPLLKASEIWRDKPAVILCIRRPGCIMCRAEAHQLYSRKPLFDALGVQLFAVIHEFIEAEVRNFWPSYWGGVVLHDRDMGFFKALGGGKVLKDKFITGFLLNPRAIGNYRRAKRTGLGIKQNFNGEGEVKGGLFIVGKGKSGIAYQFVERNFGDWAPLPEIVEICSRLQQQQNEYPSGLSESMKYGNKDRSPALLTHMTT